MFLIAPIALLSNFVHFHDVCSIFSNLLYVNTQRDDEKRKIYTYIETSSRLSCESVIIVYAMLRKIIIAFSNNSNKHFEFQIKIFEKISKIDVKIKTRNVNVY